MYQFLGRPEDRGCFQVELAVVFLSWAQAARDEYYRALLAVVAAMREDRAQAIYGSIALQHKWQCGIVVSQHAVRGDFTLRALK